MDISKIAKQRYTAKAYDSSKKLTNEQIQQIKDVLRFAPSSVNSQPWHFILATSDSAKAKIAKSAENIHPKNVVNIKDCAMVIVFCMKIDIDDEYLTELLAQEDKDGRFPTVEAKEMMKAGRGKFTNLHKHDYKDLPNWIEKQVYLNLGSTLFALSALGVNATAMEGIEPHIIDAKFNLREKGYMTSVIVTVGYSSADDFNAKLSKSRLSENSVFTEI